MQTVEYTCQYSDQVRKKHKTWHDGKLKVVQPSKRLTLHSLSNKTLLSSTIMTSDRELERILDPGDFGTAEHHIFGRYVVIICEKEGEQEETRAAEPPVRRILAKPTSSNDHPLALRMNKPFKPPRRTLQGNRPSIRQRIVRIDQRQTHRARIRRVSGEPIML